MGIAGIGKKILTLRNARRATLIGGLAFLGYLGWWWWSAWEAMAAAAPPTAIKFKETP